MRIKEKAELPLTAVPGIGRSIAGDLHRIGIFAISDLQGKNPDELYDLSNKFAGTVQDKCLLYVFRCAVYFSEGGRDPERLKWWKWKDKRLGADL